MTMKLPGVPTSAVVQSTGLTHDIDAASSAPLRTNLGIKDEIEDYNLKFMERVKRGEPVGDC